MKKLLLCAAAAALFCGCSSVKQCKEEAAPSITVTKISEKIVLDGKLDEKVWAKAPNLNKMFCAKG